MQRLLAAQLPAELSPASISFSSSISKADSLSTCKENTSLPRVDLLLIGATGLTGVSLRWKDPHQDGNVIHELDFVI